MAKTKKTPAQPQETSQVAKPQRKSPAAKAAVAKPKRKTPAVKSGSSSPKSQSGSPAKSKASSPAKSQKKSPAKTPASKTKKSAGKKVPQRRGLGGGHKTIEVQRKDGTTYTRSPPKRRKDTVALGPGIKRLVDPSAVVMNKKKGEHKGARFTKEAIEHIQEMMNMVTSHIFRASLMHTVDRRKRTVSSLDVGKGFGYLYPQIMVKHESALKGYNEKTNKKGKLVKEAIFEFELPKGPFKRYAKKLLSEFEREMLATIREADQDKKGYKYKLSRDAVGFLQLYVELSFREFLDYVFKTIGFLSDASTVSKEHIAYFFPSFFIEVGDIYHEDIFHDVLNPLSMVEEKGEQEM